MFNGFFRKEIISSRIVDVYIKYFIPSYFLGDKQWDLDIECIRKEQQNWKEQITQNQMNGNLSKKLRKDKEALIKWNRSLHEYLGEEGDK